MFSPGSEAFHYLMTKDDLTSSFFHIVVKEKIYPQIIIIVLNI